MAEMRRRGEVEKCPACGWRLDPSAYRCPKCRIYFCYKCRARVTEWESQFQCADQSCDCYGKLLCSAYVVEIPETHTTQRDVVEDDATVAALIGGAVAGGAALFAAPFVAAAVIGIGDVVASTMGLRAMGCNVWGSADQKHTKTDTHNTSDICCVECRHPVQHLR